MKTDIKYIILTLTAIISSVACGDYQITWRMINNGGGVSSLDSMSLAGTIGQAWADIIAGDGYTITSGFWSAWLGPQTPPSYTISWYTVKGGGGLSSIDSLTLIGTIGQSAVGSISTNSLNLDAGFWPGNLLCFVDFPDFALFADQWLETGPDLQADLDNDSDVDLNDLKLFVLEWLCYCPYNWPLK